LKVSLLIWDYIILFAPNEQEVYEATGNTEVIKDNVKFGSGFANSITLTMKIL